MAEHESCTDRDRRVLREALRKHLGKLTRQLVDRAVATEPGGEGARCNGRDPRRRDGADGPDR